MLGVCNGHGPKAQQWDCIPKQTYTACDQVAELCLGLASCPCVLPAARWPDSRRAGAAVQQECSEHRLPVGLEVSAIVCLAAGPWRLLVAPVPRSCQHGQGSCGEAASSTLPLLWVPGCQQSCAVRAGLRSLRGNTAGTSNAPSWLCAR